MFLDTSGLFCYLDESEESHDLAVLEFHTAPRRVTHNYVLAELSGLGVSRFRHPHRAHDFGRTLRTSPDVQAVWVDQELHDAGMDLLDRRRDKSYSLCDAISFVVMRRLGLTDALTTDHHFTQEGFVRLLA